MAPRTKPPLGGCALDGPHRLLARPGQRPADGAFALRAQPSEQAAAAEATVCLRSGAGFPD
jgi:hypothetical protein